MIIQQQARLNKQEQEIQQQANNLHPPEEQNVRKRKESDLKIVVRKVKGRARAKIEPVSLVPRTIEEAPLRRMDRRALNALRKRRADKHMIAFLLILGFIGLTLGVASVVLYSRTDFKFIGLLIIVGPIMIITGVSFLICSLELGMRLSKQIKRVMDPSLLKTNNYHEVKHWIEPELINFGWGQYDFNEEAKLLDENKMRKNS